MFSKMNEYNLERAAQTALQNSARARYLCCLVDTALCRHGACWKTRRCVEVQTQISADFLLEYELENPANVFY